MGSLKDALGLGLELSGFLIASYVAHKEVAHWLNLDDGHCLALLMGLSLCLWTLHAFFLMQKK